MPNNKNQHYVPQVYLRQFAADSDRRRLHLVLLKRPNPPVHSASIRDQCSSDYFYGKEEGLLETALQKTEGLYGTVISRVEAGDRRASKLNFLVWFGLLQQLRTERALNERLRLIDRMDNEVLRGHLKERYGNPDPRDEIQENLRIFASSAKMLDDLEVVIIENQTRVPFITSDDPSILINRLYSQRYQDPTSGLINSGVMLCLPLTPWRYLLAYDAEVYLPIGKRGTLRLRSMSDVDRLNSLQVQRAANVVFYHDAKYDEYLGRLIQAYSGLRRDDWHRLWIGVQFEETNEYIGYRTATEDEKADASGLIMSFSPILPEPAAWPRFISFKMRPRGCTNGSAVGYIRRAHAGNRTAAFREVLLPRRLPDRQTKARRDVIYHHKGALAEPLKAAIPMSATGKPSREMPNG